MEKEFVRVRSARDIIVSVALTAVGAALFIPSSIPVNILGCCIVIPGILMLLFLKTDYKDSESGLHFGRIIKYYPASMKNEVMTALKDDPSKFEWKDSPSANDGLLLDIYEGEGADKVFVRVSEFIPYNYVPCSDWLEFTKEKAGALLNR